MDPAGTNRGVRGSGKDVVIVIPRARKHSACKKISRKRNSLTYEPSAVIRGRGCGRGHGCGHRCVGHGHGRGGRGCGGRGRGLVHGRGRGRGHGHVGGGKWGVEEVEPSTCQRVNVQTSKFNFDT